MKRPNLWPGYDSGPIKNDVRSWCAIHGWLYRRGISLRDLCKELGQTEPPTLTDEYLRTIVLAYKTKHGEWPASNSSEVVEEDGRTWAGIYNSSHKRLGKILNELKSLPPPFTLDYAKSLIEAYFKKTGAWPISSKYQGQFRKVVIEGDGRTWGQLATWLAQHDSNLTKVCESLGRPTAPPFTLEYAEKVILEHREKTGEWPNTKAKEVIEGDGRSWHALSEYVYRNYGLRWSTLCAKIGKKTTSKPSWSKELIVEMIKSHVSEHGLWPSSRMPGPWHAAEAWLYKNEGLTLLQLSLQIGRPGRSKQLSWVLERVPENVVREKIQGLTPKEYAERYREWGKLWRSSNLFPKIYGKTFMEIRDGKRLGTWADLEAVKQAIQGLSAANYDKQRKGWGPLYPSSKHFERIYGQPFNKLRGTPIREARVVTSAPRRRRTDRTLAEVQSRIKTFFAAHGTRPSTKDPEWSKEVRWLRSHGTSLRQVCDELGLPPRLNLNRTLEEVAQRVLAYFKDHGRRPTASTKGWGPDDLWLRAAQGSSLSKLGDELGLPPVLNKGRTLGEVVDSIQGHFKRTGRRPTKTTSPEFHKLDGWLGHKGSSLSRVCDELGLPAVHVKGRTVAQVQDKIRAYFNEHGSRPSQETDKHWDSLNAWLHRRHKTSLPKLCDEMGLPDTYRQFRRKAG